MNDFLNSRDTVLFLGAGFSADSDLPLMKDFGTDCKKQHRAFKDQGHDNPNAAPNGDEGFRYAGPMLVKSFEVLELFQEFCKQSKIMAGDDVKDIEKVFSVAEVLKESGIPNINLGCSTYDIDELISYIQLAIWKVYHTGRLAKKNDPKNYKTRPAKKTEPGYYTGIRKKTYEPFYEQIKDYAGNLTIITTNYDLNFEYITYVSSDSESRCVYPIINGTNEWSIIAGQRTLENMNTFNDRYVDFLHDYVGGNKIGIGTQGKSAPLLCKLHGSINYFYNSKEGAGQNIYIADDLGNDEDIGNSNKWDDEPSIFAVDAIWNLQNKYGRSLMPAIIPPTYSKLAGLKWLRLIWNTAFHALANAKKILFIGYSFPDTDGFMKAMMQGAMAMRRTPKVFPLIHVIDKSSTSIDQYIKLFGDKKVTPHKMDFNKAVSSKIIKQFMEL